MKFSSVLCILPLLILSVACGKGSSKSSGKKYTKITPEEIELVMKNQLMKCASIDGSDCPVGVTRLLTLNPEAFEKSSVCSAFMVGPKTAVTNHHCIADQAECENTHLAIYKGNGRYQQTICTKIIKTEQDFANANDPRRKIDYTVFEIEATYTGAPFVLSDNRAVVGNTVNAWVIDHTGLENPIQANLLESRITQFACKVESTSDSTSMMLDKCPVIHGNSGSVALNTSGKVIGVIWGATDADVSSQEDLVTRRAGPGKAAVTEMIHFAPWI